MAGRDPEFGSLDALFTTLYASISGPPGGQDFAAAQRVFHPDSRHVRTGVDKAGRLFLDSFSLEAFEADARTRLAGLHFHEIETVRRVIRFASIAQVFSAYEARTAPEGGTLLKRGINFVHLHDDGTRWWLVHIIWDDERAGTADPQRLVESLPEIQA